MVTTSQQAAAQGTSREERQQAQIAANIAQAEIAAKSEQMPGGGINQPQYRAPSGGPTWSDSPAGMELRKQYEASGVVFDNRGNVIYNPADLGAAQVEEVRASRGLPPSSKLTGEISPEYASKVYKETGGRINTLRTQSEQLDKERAATIDAIRQTETNIKQLESQRPELQRLRNVLGEDELNRTIRAEQRQLESQKRRLQNIETARVETGKSILTAKQEQTKSLIGMAESRITSGPVQIQNALGAKVERVEPVKPTPQRTRAQTITGVKEKLFASPTFMQEAETYTRPPAFLGETRKQRPKAQQGVTDKLFQSPTYVTKEQQRQKDKTFQVGKNITLGLTENIGTERVKQPQAFAISLSEGAPPKPRELTQEQVNAMTPEQYAVYKAEFDAYNRYVKEENKRIKQENVRQLRESLKNLKSFIDVEKAKGTKSIVVVTDEGEKRIPIGQAYLGIQRIKNIKSIYTDIVIPEGYTVAGTIATPVFVSEKPPMPTEAAKTDALSKAVKSLEQYKAVVGERGPVKQTPEQIIVKEGLAGVGIGLGATGAFFAGGLQQIKNTLLSPKTPIANVLQSEKESPYVAPTAGGIALGAPITAAIQGKKDLFGEGERELSALKQKLGEVKFGGTLVAAGIELLNPIKAVKAIKSGLKFVPETTPAIKQLPSVKFAAREGTKILEPVKPFPQSKLRSQGFEPTPEITPGIRAGEEAKIRKSFEIPEPFVKEAGTVTGKRPIPPTLTTLEEAERIRKLEIERLKSITKSEPVKPDVLYTPGVELRRAPEPKTFRVDEKAMFGADTAKGSQFTKEGVELGQAPTVITEPSRGPLGGVIIREIVAKPFKSETIPLGVSTKTITKISLGKGETRIIGDYGKKNLISLGSGSVDILRVEKGKIEKIPDVGGNLYPKDASTLEKLRGLRLSKEFKEHPGFIFKSKDQTRSLLQEVEKGGLGKREGKRIPQQYYKLEQDIFKVIERQNLAYDKFRKGKITKEELKKDIAAYENYLQRLREQQKKAIFEANPDLIKNIEFPKQYYKIKKTKEAEAAEDLQKLIEKPGFKQKPVEEEFGYSPQKELPITRAKEIKTYKVQTKDLLGKTENPLKNIFEKTNPLVKEGTTKPGLRQLEKKAELEKEFPQLLQKKAFERSAAYAESVRVEYPFVGTETRLGSAIVKKYLLTKAPKGFTRDLVDVGRGKGFYVSKATGESSLKRFTKPPEPPKEGPSKGAQQLVLEKPTQSKFKSVQVELGEGKGAVVAAGGTAAVPAIPLTKAIAEGQIPDLVNGTGTNATDVQVEEAAPSVLEPAQITEQRQDVFAAAQSPQAGQLYGIEAAKARRAGLATIIKVTPTQTEKERQVFGMPTPSAQPSKLAQPTAFKQPEKQKFRSGFPSPQPLTPTLKQPFPFPEKIIPIEILRPPIKTPPRLGRPFPPPPKPIKTPRKGKKRKPNQFLGNASEEEIALGFNRTEIITGIERTERQLKKDIMFSRKLAGIDTKFITQKTGSVLSKKKQSILYREKPKEIARQKRKTGGFF